MTRLSTRAGHGLLAALLALALAGGCESASGEGDGAAARYLGQLAHTLLVGTSDNAEVVRAVPGRPLVLLLSSKARKATLLRVEDGRLAIAREKALFENDTTESELTSIDVSADGTWAVATRTLIETDASGAQTHCGGALVFFDATDSEAFGAILAQVDVGPMPDAIDISPDDRLVVSANERDGPDAWGKCEVPGATPSVSVIDVSGGPASATERHRIEMVDGDTGPREPEGIVFSNDSDLVVATLQDSHEIAIFRVSSLAGKATPTSADVRIVRLPDNALGAGPWPDGVTRFEDASGAERFVAAGEWNDTLTVFDGEGTIVASVDVSARDLPESLPRVVDEGSPLFSPDSVVSFARGGRTYVAVTLRHAGAVAVYDVSDAARPTFAQATPVGQSEAGKADEEGSTVRPEGVAAAADGAFLVTANEAESSASLVLPVE